MASQTVEEEQSRSKNEAHVNKEEAKNLYRVHEEYEGAAEAAETTAASRD
jgi:hypothetical protein